MPGRLDSALRFIISKNSLSRTPQHDPSPGPSRARRPITPVWRGSRRPGPPVASTSGPESPVRAGSGKVEQLEAEAAA